MRRAFVLAAGIVAVFARPAAAWDPDWDALDAGTVDRRPDPAPLVVPEGLYLVTDVYAGDVVTRSGDTITYGTTTVSETPGTYARVIDVVGTGGASAYDGASLNGRAHASDGRPVAGTYYEDFVLSSSGFISVNVVFFQDDSETHRRDEEPTAIPRPTSSPAPVTTVPTGPAPSARPVSGPTTVTARPTVEPIERGEPLTLAASAGIALGPAAPVLARLEVLRARRVQLFPRAFVNGDAVAVRTWRLASGVVNEGSCTGSGTSASCEATWTELPPAGQVWTLRFELTTDALPGRTIVATIEVAVRSPALEQ